MKEKFHPGKTAWIAADAPSSQFSAVFEDDGSTGFFYAYDRERQTQPILDAVHIYNVASVDGRHRDWEAEIVWSPDGSKVGLLLNGHLQAVFDFNTRAGFCRNNFPPPTGAWAGPERMQWSDSLAVLFPENDVG